MKDVTLNLLLVILTASYITLGIFSSDTAGNLWAPYAGAVLVIGVAELVTDGRRRRHRAV